MKLFIAGLDTETNTFAPIPTGRRAFADGFIAHGDATRQPENYCSAQLNVWRRRGEERGWAVAESLCAFAEPGGTVVRAVYEELRDEILDLPLDPISENDHLVLAGRGIVVALEPQPGIAPEGRQLLVIAAQDRVGLDDLHGTTKNSFRSRQYP
jgi:microcystin degradation protein MlrC